MKMDRTGDSIERTVEIERSIDNFNGPWWDGGGRFKSDNRCPVDVRCTSVGVSPLKENSKPVNTADT